MSRTLVQALLALPVFLLGFAAYLCGGHWFGLHRSLDALLLHRLGVTYQVEAAELAWLGSDARGVWRVRPDGDVPSLIDALQREGFGESAADLVSFNGGAPSELGGDLAMGGYHSYQAELGLSPFLCDDVAPCRVEVLANTGASDVYVAISSP